MFMGQILSPALALDLISKERELEYQRACKEHMARQARRENGKKGSNRRKEGSFPVDSACPSSNL